MSPPALQPQAFGEIAAGPLKAVAFDGQIWERNDRRIFAGREGGAHAGENSESKSTPSGGGAVGRNETHGSEGGGRAGGSKRGQGGRAGLQRSPGQERPPRHERAILGDERLRAILEWNRID